MSDGGTDFTPTCGAWFRRSRDEGEHVCTLPAGHTGHHEEVDGTPHAVTWEEGTKE